MGKYNKLLKHLSSELNMEENDIDIMLTMLSDLDSNNSKQYLFPSQTRTVSWSSYVYFALTGDNTIKIGTSKNVRNRMKRLTYETGSSHRVIGKYHGTEYQEREMHKLFKESRLHHEYFNITDELLDYIEKHCSWKSIKRIKELRLMEHS